ncbi:DEAD/DEAH box helicase [Catenovulum maritimum]|uniref:Carboxylate--amine ligase n=1 Tax=Catenovulum maritimum TaxID=1513271 RepID=A0A0J8GX65_9ALTE|nr:DEAD/DEAH box helicase [Catenovulum maritimum]KMT65308.1 carboxylate--amine ligase [Catenovulum maritimum]
MYKLRPYQQEAVDATLAHFRKTNDSAVIVLPTGAGKSLVIAELAKLARRPILVITHVKELVEQNHQKYESYGLKAGIFSAGLNAKQTDFSVTFASIQSISKSLDLFDKSYSLIIIDECHRVGLINPKQKPDESQSDTNEYQKVIRYFTNQNANLKILGLTATPYRLDSGWIYQKHYFGFYRSEKPVQFVKCIYELPLRYMIKNEYLTPPKLINAAIEHYDFSSLKPGQTGEYKTNDVNELLLKYPRVTQAICEQIANIATNKSGVMIFAASVKHAEEIAQYISSFDTTSSYALVTAKTSSEDRAQLIKAFKAKQIRYLINVSVLTTGFDAPHVDFIAILRPTQSVSLYQQIVGRGLRLDQGKKECLIIDYAGNDFDLHHPEVGSLKPDSKSIPVSVPCPQCQFNNIFWGKVDQDGDLIEHYGRRCQGMLELTNNQESQCQFRFVFKQCPNCNHENDIAARVCNHCQHQLIDADELIKDALKLKNYLIIRCADMKLSEHNHKLKITYYDEDGLELIEFYDFKHNKSLKSFNQDYGLRFKLGACPTEFKSITDVLNNSSDFTCPDFVIAKKEKHFTNVKNKIFDYSGKFRKANQL